MSSRKTTLFYSLLIMVASLAVGMVIASRLELTPASSAQTTGASLSMPPMNSAPLSGPVNAQTFRNIAQARNPTVVNVHQFADQQRRDAMVASLQDLRFRALRPYGNVWVVESFVIVLLGPQRDEVEALIKAEYQRRNPGAG